MLNVIRATNPSPSVVGWPPIRSFRRNLGLPQASKSAMDSEKDIKKMKPVEGENASKEHVAKQTMFVKVNMEGYAVGRKIDLKVHDSYESLSQALQKMFHNFLTADYSKKAKEDGEDEIVTPSYILLYEDNEGDRMLVGDVPWEMFISTVKRLYIAQDHRNTKMGLTAFEPYGESN